MKTIIVPVDFSAASINAANYALSFAEVIKASIALLHVYQFPIAFTESPVPAQVTGEMLEDVEKQIHELKNELLHKSGGRLKIYAEIKEGQITTQLQDYCKRLDPYAILMGARGISTTERVLFGSNTLSAMKHLAYPLIIVPIGATFKKIEKVGLACDLHSISETVHAVEIKRLVSDFQAKLHVLYINTVQDKMIGDEEIEGSAWLREILMEVKPNFHFLRNPNIEEAIQEFAEKNSLDMLIVIPKKHGLLEGIFHRSETKHIALHSHIPLLSIHE